MGLAVVTIALGLGLTRLRFETGILDWLPSGNPNVQAFGRMLERLDGVTNQELIWVELDPEKAARAGVEHIHDEAAVRAQQELIDYVRERVPRIRHAFGLPHWFSLMHRANRGGDPSAYRLPEASFEYRLIWHALWTTNRKLLEPTLSPDRRATFVGLVVEGNPLEQLAREVGYEIEQAVAAYRVDPEREYDLFLDDYLVPVGLASGTAFIDRTLRRDVVRLLPLAVGAIVVALLLAFRRPGIAAAGMGQVLVGVVWTYGLLGWSGVPLNVVNVALVPLVFGCGVDYSIHFLNEYGQGRRRGTARLGALGKAARASGVGILLTTLTTVSGLLSLVLADLPGMVQLGLFAAFSMVALAVLSVTFLPAVISMRPSGGRPASIPESWLLGEIMERIAQRRGLVMVAFVAMTVAAAVVVGRPVRLLDPIRGNYPPGEPVAQTVERMQERAGAAFPEFLIVEGDLASPGALRTMERLERALNESPVLDGQIVAGTYAQVLGAHEILGGGTVAAVRAFLEAGGDPLRALPDDREAAAASMREMHEDPGWRPFASLFFDPQLDLGVGLVLVRDGFEGLEGARELWEELDRILASVSEDAPVSLSFLGYRTMSYLFLEESLRWLRILYAVSFTVSMALVVAFLRDPRALAAIAALMIATGIWWLAMLRMADIYLSVFLLFPLVFVISIGSDYGLHLSWRLTRRESRRRVFRTAGRAVLFSALTDGVVFALFVPIGLVSASQVMLSIALAVLAVFVATLLVVPACFGGAPRRREPKVGNTPP